MMPTLSLFVFLLCVLSVDSLYRVSITQASVPRIFATHSNLRREDIIPTYIHRLRGGGESRFLGTKVDILGTIKEMRGIVMPMYECFSGFVVGCAIILTWYSLSSEILDRIVYHERHIPDAMMKAVAIVGSMFGAAGAGVCIGIMTVTHATAQAAIVGAIFTALQILQFREIRSNDAWFAIGSTVHYIPVCIAAANFMTSAKLRQQSGPTTIRNLPAEISSTNATSSAPANATDETNTTVPAPAPASLPAPVEATQGPLMGGVHFSVQLPPRAAGSVAADEVVAVCGSDETLGRWRVESALCLRRQHAAGDSAWWSGSMTLPAGTEGEYKYILLAPSRSRWECLAANRRFAVPADGSLAHVIDTWELSM